MFKYTVVLVAVLTLTSCGGDNADDWVGTWTMQSIDGMPVEQALIQSLAEEGYEGISKVSLTDEWTFTDEGKVSVELDLKIEMKAVDGTKVSAEAKMKAVGTYTLSGDAYTFTLTITEGSDIFGSGSGEEATGTYERNGSTLTLAADGGWTIIFKRK